MQRKPDIGIGHRAAAECRRLFPKRKQAAIAIGCERRMIGYWGQGQAPSAIYLARLHELGADVIWILTGKKEK